MFRTKAYLDIRNIEIKGVKIDIKDVEKDIVRYYANKINDILINFNHTPEEILNSYIAARKEIKNKKNFPIKNYNTPFKMYMEEESPYLKMKKEFKTFFKKHNITVEVYEKAFEIAYENHIDNEIKNIESNIKSI